MKLPGFLRKDNFVLGAAMGLVLPVVFYFFLLLVDLLFLELFSRHLARSQHLLYLLSVIVNLLPVRHYLVKLKHEKTGLGLLATTAILILVYFYLFFNQ
jgi:hypothetical protein